jgi:hypothetical protein
MWEEAKVRFGPGLFGGDLYSIVLILIHSLRDNLVAIISLLQTIQMLKPVGFLWPCYAQIRKAEFCWPPFAQFPASPDETEMEPNLVVCWFKVGCWWSRLNNATRGNKRRRFPRGAGRCPFREKCAALPDVVINQHVRKQSKPRKESSSDGSCSCFTGQGAKQAKVPRRTEGGKIYHLAAPPTVVSLSMNHNGKSQRMGALALVQTLPIKRLLLRAVQITQYWY